MANLDLFTDKANQVVKLAASAAAKCGVTEFGADYVLIGLAEYREPCIARAVIDQLHIALDAMPGEAGPVSDAGSIEQSIVLDSFVTACWAESKGLGHNYVGTEHLLLAIIPSQSAAAQFLRNAGAEYRAVKRAVRLILAGPAK